MCFYNRKGGVGKSTICSNMAYAYTQIGKKVLVVDLDSQRDCSFLFGLTDEIINSNKCFDDIFSEKDKEINFDEFVIPVRENLYVMSNRNLKAIESQMNKVSRIDAFLKYRMANLEKLDFDYIMIDCSPADNKINDAVFCYVDGMIVVTEPEPSSIRAVGKIFECLSDLYIDPGIIKTVIPNRYRNTNIHKENMGILKSIFDENIITEPIPLKSKISETQRNGLTIFEYDRETSGYFMETFKKIIETTD